MRNPFERKYELTLNRVHDTIYVREGSEELKLVVNSDSQMLVAGLNKAQKKLSEITDEADLDGEEIKETALYFASVIFGPEQARQLMTFYADDPASVITVCGQYFKGRLAQKILKVQKKAKVK